MNHILKVFIVTVCIASISCNEWFNRDAKKEVTKDDKQAARSLLISKLQNMVKSINETAISEEAHDRAKRQVPLAYAGGFGLGYGLYDYNDYYGDYVNDYNYDYYDWVCSDTFCQLCDILTSECCNPIVDINCFLPDSCLNNPCLAGGTCVTTRTPDLRPDFICVCLPGLTGKYCQLANDYFVGGNIIDPILSAGPIGPIAPVAPAVAPAVAPGPPAVAPAVGPAGGFGGYGGYGGYGAPAAPVAAPVAGGYGGYGAPAAPAYGQQVAPVADAAYAPQYAAPAVQPEAAPAYGAQPAYGGQDVQAAPAAAAPYGVRTLSSKRVKCAAGQVFNYEKNACSDFSLKRKAK